MDNRNTLELEKQQRRFEHWLSKQKLSNLNPITSQTVHLSLLLSLCYEDRKDGLPLHAIWYLEKYLKVYRERLTDVIPSLIQHLHQLSCGGSERIAGNILLENFRKPRIYALSIDEKDKLIELCFHWIIQPKKAVAVVANALEIIYHLVDEQEWIREELCAQIALLETRCSPALIARGRKITQQLKRCISSRNR